MPFIGCDRRDCGISLSYYIDVLFVSVKCELCYVLIYSSCCHRLAVINVIVIFPSHITLVFFASVNCELCYFLLYASCCHWLAVIGVIVTFPSHITLMLCL